ncbi:MAG: CHAT domain-containing protein [Acidobacteriota bacterium]|nr:CHAT domain-containing protein [Acidobacteriota bacterium]
MRKYARDNLGKRLLEIEKHLRKEISAAETEAESSRELRESLEFALKAATYESAREVASVLNPVYGITDNPLTPNDPRRVKRDIKIAIKRAARKLERPVLAKLRSHGVTERPQQAYFPRMIALILEEAETFSRRRDQGIDVKPREKANMIPANTTDLSILFLAANPDQTSRLQLDEEARLILKRIRSGSHRDAIRLETRWAVRLDDILEALNELRPKIVHFSGHGEAGAAGGICIVQNDGAPRLLSAEQLLDLFIPFVPSVQVVVLNSCHSESQALAISRIVDFTVGMRAGVGDGAARDFSGQFYSALAFGRPVDEAFQQAVAKLKIDHPAESNTPTLIQRPGAESQVGVVLRAPKESDFRSLASLLNSLYRGFFSSRSSDISLLASAATALEKSGGRGSGSASAGKQVLGGIEKDLKAVKALSAGLKEVLDRRKDSFHPLAIEKAQSILDQCAPYVQRGDDVLGNLRTPLQAMALLSRVRTEEAQLLPPDNASEIARTVSSYCRTCVSLSRTVSVEFGKFSEYVPDVLRSQLRFENWRYEKHE